MLVLDDVRHRARVAHLCDSCGRSIDIGETYRRQRIIGDEPYVYRYCAHCDAVAQRAWHVDRDAFDPDYGFDLAEWLADVGRDERSELGDVLYEQMRNRWRDDTGVLIPVPTFAAGVSTE